VLPKRPLTFVIRVFLCGKEKNGPPETGGHKTDS
jgi:hypothetical protein